MGKKNRIDYAARTLLDILQSQHALLDRILHDKTLYKDVLLLSKAMNTIVCLGLCGIIPREIHAKKDRQHKRTRLARRK